LKAPYYSHEWIDSEADGLLICSKCGIEVAKFPKMDTSYHIPMWAPKCHPVWKGPVFSKDLDYARNFNKEFELIPYCGELEMDEALK